MTEKEALIILNAIPAISNRRILELIKHFGGAAEILRADRQKLLAANILPEKAIGNISRFPQEEFLKKELALMEKYQARVVAFDEDDYPQVLLNIPDAPVVLYVKGELPGAWEKTIALVGSRNASVYGISTARAFAQRLSEKGITVISGLAKGIDRASHEGALSVGAPTVAVIGCGLMHIYPLEHADLYRAIEARGVIISEFPMNTLPLPFNFPRRNRIISGLARGVCVVEAAAKSGALITADFALEQGKEVYAIPGPIDRANTFGAHQLIKQGAKMVTSIEDVLEDYGDFSDKLQPSVPGEGNNDLNEEELAVFQRINDRPLHLDEITEASGMRASGLSQILLQLELKHKIKELPGKYFILLRNSCKNFGIASQE